MNLAQIRCPGCRKTLERREKIRRHAAYIQLSQEPNQLHEPIAMPTGPPLARAHAIKMTRYPSIY